MRISVSRKLFNPTFIKTLAIGAVMSCAGQALAQYGASPSQTGLFFDDLRTRSQQQKASAGVRSGEAVYDYERGIYFGTDDDDMGVRSVMADDPSREIAQPSVRSGSASFAARSVGDYTNYAGQYTTPTSYFAPTYISDPFLAGRRNLKLGPVNVGFGLYSGLEYNDNVNRANGSTVAEIGDVVASNILNFDVNYPVTKNNTLSISTAVGFDHYFEHPELAPYGNGNYILNVLPGSTIAFDMRIGPVFVTIYDRISVRPAVRNDFALSANQVFGVFQNDAGVATLWQINSELQLAINFQRSDSLALETAQERFSRSMNSIHTSLTWSPHGTWALGLEGGVSWINYMQDFNNDGVLGNASLVFTTPIGRSTNIKAMFGVQNFDFNQPTGLPPIAPGDFSDLNDFFYSVTISNQINSRISHAINFGREAALNLVSNYVMADYVNYGISFIVWKGARLSVSAFLEDSSMSGGFFAEDLSQRGVDVYFSHQLSSRMRLGLGYHFGRTESQGRGLGVGPLPRDFDQHAFNVDLSYQLSRKASLIFGYRHLTTDAANAALSFDQNRFITALNYNF
jgi:hypothetical protein